MSVFGVYVDSECISVWRDYGNAYAAAGEAGAMDPERCYSVEEISEDGLSEFWFWYPELTLH